MTLRAGLLVALAVLLLDQGLKLWALQGSGLPLHGHILLLGGPEAGLGLTLVLNPGIVFGMVLPVGGQGHLLIVLLAAMVAGVVLVRMVRSRRLLLNLARGAVVGGAASNVADRVRIGAVVDYLAVHRGRTAVVFNLADIAVLLGAILLLAGAAAYAVAAARAA